MELSGSADEPLYARTDEDGRVTPGGSERDYNVKWDGVTLTLKAAYITGGYETTPDFTKGIYSNGSLDLVLIGENTVARAGEAEAYYHVTGISVGSNLSITGGGDTSKLIIGGSGAAKYGSDGIDAGSLHIKNCVIQADGHGASKNFTGLPAGTEYTVTENSGDGWRATVGGLETKTVSGTITAGAETTLEFVNTPVEPRLTVAKTASAESLEAGETVDFTITVTNAGEGPLSDITLTDLFEGGAGELVFADLPEGVSRSPDGSFAIAGLAPGESVEIKSAYTALEEDEGKTLTNSAAAKSSGGASGEDKVSVEVEDGGIYVPPSDKPVHDTPAENAVPPMLNGEDHFAYVIGYDDGTVRPEGQITRAEVAAIIFRLLDPEVRDENLTAENGFDDVGEGDWYNTAVSTLVKLGIISGRSDTSFDPNAPITRAEFATLFARFDESGAEPAGGFSDLSGHWARESVGRAAALGWIDGYEDGSFRPDNRITRAEAMTMVNRVLNRNPAEEEDLLPDMRVWSDNQPGSWYYFAVQEATNSHEYTRPDSHEDWTKLTEDPDWDRYQ